MCDEVPDCGLYRKNNQLVEQVRFICSASKFENMFLNQFKKNKPALYAISEMDTHFWQLTVRCTRTFFSILILVLAPQTSVEPI